MKATFIFIFTFITLIAAAPVNLKYSMPEPIPIEIEHSDVKELLCKVPDDEREEFVKVLKAFGDARNLDWKYCLLIMWGESHIDTKAIGGDFVGLIMFGYHARQHLNVSKEELLQMNHVEQAKAAIKIWEANEKFSGVKLNSFIRLEMSTFLPAFIGHPGNPYPASEIIRSQNYPLCDASGQLTQESILSFVRKKIYYQEELKYFRGRI